MAKKLVEFLRAMLFNKVYSSQTINYLFDSQSYASRCKNDALAKGLIKKVDYKKRERTAHTITLFFMCCKLEEPPDIEDLPIKKVFKNSAIGFVLVR